MASQHFIPLLGVEARYLKLVIQSSYGSSRRTQLAEVKILEAPEGDSIVADVPIDLALPALGGTVLRFSSAHYRGEAPRLLQGYADGKGWRSTDDRLPQELTFCLRDDAEALIDRLVLNLDAGFDAASRPLEIAIALSPSSPTAGFVEAAREVLAELIGTLPKDVEVALRVYGHRIREGRRGDCQDTELVYPFERLDKARLIARINAIKALGTTPIAYALGRTSEDFGETPGEKTVILEQLRAVYVETDDFTKAAIAFGDGVAGSTGVAALEWNHQRGRITGSFKQFRAAYAAKYEELLARLEAVLHQIGNCEAQHFGNEDWYNRYGFMFQTFMSMHYAR